VDIVNRFVLNPHSGLVVGSVTAVVIGIAVFFLGAPPIILIPVGLLVTTLQLELKYRARRKLDRS
jgi:hypothetical protein